MMNKKTSRNLRRRRRRTRFGSGRRFRIVWKRLVPTVALTAMFLYASVNLFQYAVRSVKTKRTNEELQVLYEEAMETLAQTSAPEASPPEPTATPEPGLLDAYQYISDAILPEAAKLMEKNPDVVAWLNIPGVLSLPVVYRDNSYYLDHDFYENDSSSGTLFLDELHPLVEDTQYMVIHGHNMYDGSMFGRLTHYREQEYMKEHPTVYLNTLYRQEEYEVIGVLRVTSDSRSEDYVAYVGTRAFQSLERFNAFATDIRRHAIFWKDGTKMLPSDALLALSTCYKDDDRIVVMCRRVSP